MAYTTIDDPSAHFQIATYTGNGSTGQNITNDGNSDLQPDWVWAKRRDANTSHGLVDSSRGVRKVLSSNNTDAEVAESAGNTLTAFLSDGFTVGDDGNYTAFNANGSSIVAWQWKANGGTTTSVSASGTVLAGTYQANTTAGFSIITYTGEDDTVNTVTHGLGAVPAWIIVKGRSGSGRHWRIYHHKNTSAPETDYLKLNATDATADDVNYWYDTAPTSSVFSISTANDVNANTETYVAYCFTEIQGYSKFGSYTGNGNADGPFVYTGFKPAWVMVKEYGANTNDWNIYDSKRSAFNSMDDILEANLSDAEGTGRADIDFLSNGFKQRNTHADSNRSGGTFIYMAFAESPFVSSKGVPTTAR